jgi:hypothetical protein
MRVIIIIIIINNNNNNNNTNNEKAEIYIFSSGNLKETTWMTQEWWGLLYRNESYRNWWRGY